eukprot:615348-Pyramimonas_sp.AAC.1
MMIRLGSSPRTRARLGYILTTDPSDAGSTGIFSRRTNRLLEVRTHQRASWISTPSGVTTGRVGGAGARG